MAKRLPCVKVRRKQFLSCIRQTDHQRARMLEINEEF